MELNALANIQLRLEHLHDMGELKDIDYVFMKEQITMFARYLRAQERGDKRPWHQFIEETSKRERVKRYVF